MASSTRSTARAKSSATTSREPKATSTSSPTTSTSSTSPRTVVIALGSNVGDRRYNLRRAIDELRRVVQVVCVSSFHETAPVDAPPGSPPFLNAVVVGHTTASPIALLRELLAIEVRHGRVRRHRNEPRRIDLDLIAYGATRMRHVALTLPHPRAREREFVLAPLRECSTAVGAFLQRR